jgi:photosystem II stability/assembly factor-like uncharacterized protein
MAVFLSSNGGASWTTVRVVTQKDSYAYAVARDPSNPNNLYVGGASGAGGALLCKSTNGGASWTDVTKNIRGTILDIQVDPASPNIVYAVTWGRVWRSTDGGASWTETSVDSVQCLIINPKNPKEIFAGTGYDGVCYSADRGVTWQDLSADLDIKYIECLDLDPAARILYAGTYGGGIFKRKF